MNILACASGFGLGPGGKLSSIIEKVLLLCGKDVRWYACGDKIDTAIFKNNIFLKVCWTRDEEKIVKFVKENNIKLAIVILDPDVAIILQRNGVDVFFVDSLPFLWTEADVIPFNVTQYFAQKCMEMSEEATKIINKVENLKWVDPIVADIKASDEETKYKVIINLGGLHSTVDRGRGYVDLVLSTLIDNLLKKYKTEEIIITCGSNASKVVREVLYSKGINNINVSTLVQKEFLKLVINCELFITSPGLTTIYETCKYDKNTILLPPQNLSQYYNSNFAKNLIKKIKLIEWNKYDLELEYFKKYLYLGEDLVVEIIFKNIDNASRNNEYKRELYENIEKILNTDFKSKNVVEFGEDGAEIIAQEIRNFVIKYKEK